MAVGRNGAGFIPKFQPFWAARGEKQVVIVLHAPDIGVLIAFAAKGLVVGIGKFSPQIVVVGQFGEFDDIRLAAEAGDTEKLFILCTCRFVAGREDGRNDIPCYVRAKGDIDEQVGVLQVRHDLPDGLERNITLGRINKNEVQAAIWQAVQNSAQAGSVAVIANHGLGDVGGIEGFDALIEDVHDALAGVNEDAFFEFGKLFMTDDGQSRASISVRSLRVIHLPGPQQIST